MLRTKNKKTQNESSGLPPQKSQAARPRRDWKKYEVIEDFVFGRGSTFRSIISRRLDQGYNLYGNPFFYRKAGKLWGVQVLVDLQGLVNEGLEDAINEKDNRSVRPLIGFTTEEVSAKEGETKSLHKVQRVRSPRI